MPLISVQEALARGYRPSADKAWTLDVTGPDIELSSPRFGNVRTVVVTDEAGEPLWERPQYNEGPHIVAVAWGRKEGTIYVGLVLETRPHAQHPAREGDQVFWGVPRGFRKPGESAADAIKREVGDEAGGRVIISTHDVGWINPNPTFVGTYSPLVFVEVDIDRIDAVRPERHEKIYRAKYIGLDELMHAINGTFQEGGYFEDGVSLAAIMRFVSWVWVNNMR